MYDKKNLLSLLSDGLHGMKKLTSFSLTGMVILRGIGREKPARNQRACRLCGVVKRLKESWAAEVR